MLDWELVRTLKLILAPDSIGSVALAVEAGYGGGFCSSLRSDPMTDFKGHRFEKDVILTCVQWYLAYPLSYRNLEKMMAERGADQLLDHLLGRAGSLRWRLRTDYFR
jgi:hypothetical protein